MQVGNTKVGWGQYFKPTPKNVQKMADGLIAFSAFITGSAIMADMKWLAFAFVVVGALGAFGQKLFSNGG